MLFAGKLAWAPLRHRLDSLAVVLSAHQPILLDEFDVGLGFHDLSQAPAHSSAGRDYGQRRIFCNLRRELGRCGWQAVCIDEDISKSPCQCFFAVYPPSGEKHQICSLIANQTWQRVGETETWMDSDLYEVRRKSCFWRYHPKIGHQGEPKPAADRRTLN